jgi:hypothetical protein
MEGHMYYFSIINSLVKLIFPPLLGELLCGGKNEKVKNDHKSFLREN